MEAKGYGSVVEFDGKTIVIKRNKVMAGMIGIGETVIPVAAITNVGLSEATFLTNGLFCVTVRLENGLETPMYTSAAKAQESPYSVIVTKKHVEEFTQLVEAVQSVIPDIAIPIHDDQTNRTKFALRQEKNAKLEKRIAQNELLYEQRHPEGRFIKKFKGDDGTVIELFEKGISCNREKHDICGVRATVEDGSALESRVTLTRLLLIGVFAVAFKKKKGGERYLTIEGDDFACISLVNRKRIKEAINFATMINNQAKKHGKQGSANTEEESNGIDEQNENNTSPAERLLS